MSSIEEKALALVRGCEGCESWKLFDDCLVPLKALCRAIEAHEADKQAFSDAVEACIEHIKTGASGSSLQALGALSNIEHILSRFIIKKPDPLVEILGEEVSKHDGVHEELANRIRKALAARGLGVARIGEVVEGQQQ